MHSQWWIFVPAVAALLINSCLDGVDAVCKNEGKKCASSSPCCFNGNCGSDVKSCSEGCDFKNSFSSTSCYPLPMCSNYNSVFTDSNRIQPRSAYNGNPNSCDWVIEDGPNYASINNNELLLEMKAGKEPNKYGRKEGVGATISWSRYMQYGKMTAVIKTAVTSPGVVSSFITMSPEGDEIDFEWVGKDRKQVQSNYYYNGILDYSKGGKHPLEFDTTQDFHEYSIDWQPDYISWYVDGNLLRTVQRSSTKQSNGTYFFPNKVSHVQFGLWDGGQGAAGTAEWAGTPTDWTNPSTVYNMHIKEIRIECRNPNATTWPPTGGVSSSSSSIPVTATSTATATASTTTNVLASSSATDSGTTSSISTTTTTTSASASTEIQTTVSSTTTGGVDASTVSSSYSIPTPTNVYSPSKNTGAYLNTPSTSYEDGDLAYGNQNYNDGANESPAPGTVYTDTEGVTPSIVYNSTGNVDSNTNNDVYGSAVLPSSPSSAVYHSTAHNCTCQQCKAAQNQTA